MKYFNLGSVLLGLVVPLCGVVGGVALLSGSGAIVLGFPVVYLWVFAWFVLTPMCLALSWYLFDSKDYDEDGVARGERGAGREEARMKLVCLFNPALPADELSVLLGEEANS